MRKLTARQILSLPTLTQTMTGKQIGDKWGVTSKTVYNHVKSLRKRGHNIKWKRGARPIIK